MTITHWDGMLANATTFRSGSATNERLFFLPESRATLP